MKILICHSSLGSGGIESMVVNLANEMSKSHDVSVLTIFKPRETDICFKRLSGNIKTLTLGKNKPGISLSLLLGIIRLFFCLAKVNSLSLQIEVLDDSSKMKIELSLIA